jgi:hypothetical protein
MQWDAGCSQREAVRALDISLMFSMVCADAREISGKTRCHSLSERIYRQCALL